MFPDFFGVDMTFGVNKEQRDIFLVAGIDGSMKTQTAFRVFLPSKQGAAYRWVINNATIHLLGTETIQANRCTASDNESALVNSINGTINTPGGPYQNSKHRQDPYHLFNQD